MLSEIPLGWSERRLKDLIRRDATYVRSLAPGHYRRVSVRLYGRGVGVGATESAEQIKMDRHQFARAGQVVVSEIWAKKGAVGIVPPHADGALVTSHFYLFDAIDPQDVQWLDALLRAGWFTRRLDALAQGTTGYASVRPKDILVLPVATPPVAERRAIGLMLSAVAHATQSAEQLVNKLASQKRGVMRALLTGGTHRHEMVPLPGPWPLGRIADGVTHLPASWRLVQLTRFAKLESGHTPSRKHPEYWGGAIPWLSLEDAPRLEDLTVAASCEHVTEAGIANSSARLLPKDTVLFVRTGGSLGACSRLARPMATCQDYANFVCGPELEPRYLVQVFRHMDREWKRLRCGSTTLRSVYMPVFKSLRILLPPLDEQRAIADVGDAFDERIAAETTYLERLREHQRGLAQALLSGRVRLPPKMIEALNNGAPHVG